MHISGGPRSFSGFEWRRTKIDSGQVLVELTVRADVRDLRLFNTSALWRSLLLARQGVRGE